NQYALIPIIKEAQNQILSLIENYHNSFPMRQGINKAEIISELTTKYTLRILEVAINRLKNNKDIDINEQYISLKTFIHHLQKENKAEIITKLTNKYLHHILEIAINRLKNNKDIDINEQYISLNNFTPHLPNEWQKRLVKIEEDLISQGAETNKWNDLLASSNLPSIIQTDFYYYLIQTKRAFVLDDERLISRLAVDEAIKKL